MSENITIIKALPPERWSEYRDLRIKGIETDTTAFGTTLEDENSRTEQQWKDRLSTIGTIRMFFAEENGKLVGMIGTNVQVMEKIRHNGTLLSFYVDPSARGRGVGGVLIQAALDYLKELGYIKRVKLAVTTTQEPAINLYKKFGFETTGTEPCEMVIDGKCFDQYIMSMALRQA